MGGEWREVTLGEFVTLQRGHDLPGTTRTDGAVPVLGSFGITGWHNESRAKGPGVTIGRSGASFGVVSYSPVDYWPLNTALYVKNFHGNDPKFAFYFLKILDFERYNSGSAQPSLNRNYLYPIPIKVPSIQEQKAIAHILGTLDDKIEINRQMNTTLESMAQALFKSWFVDFDPVIDNALAAGNPIPEPFLARAKSRKALGDKRRPLPESLQQQFPSSFVFTEEMGWIPEGWKFAELGDYELEIESGRRPKGGIDKELSEGIPSVGAESICPIGEFDYGKAKIVTREFANNAKKGWVKDYDVALYKDGGKLGLFKPRVSLYGEGFPYQDFMVNEHVFLLRSKRLGPFFLYYTVAAQTFFDQLVAKGSAKAAQPGINQGEVCDTQFLKPDDNVISRYNDLIGKGISRRLALGKSSMALSRVRDLLLPKLLSGQLRIPDAEKLMADAL